MRSKAWRPAAVAGNRRPGRYGKPPPGTTTRCEELAGTDRDTSPVRKSAAPEPKTATVERREASVLRRTQGASPAPGLPRYVQAQRVPRKHPYDSRRSAHPFRGCVKRKNKTRAQKRAAGTKRCCLVLALSVGHSGRAAVAARAGIHNHGPWVWIPGSQALPAPRNDARKTRRGNGRGCLQ